MAEVKEIKEKQVVKIDEKDIERVKQFRTDFADVTARLGEIEVELLNTQIILDNIEGVKVELQTKFRDLRSEELNLTNEFKEKYGNGEFNIEQGTFTPIS
jgi:predicted nuclease with TOPRIM domain|tara:strand:- start:77 stop:376 length:300 start_codon:yes stop_codon:yes gene_type:complete